MDVFKTGVVDYVIFVSFLLISFIIGIFYAFKSRKNPSEDEYFLGGRRIHVFAASCSAAASAFVGSHVIALPNDSYFRGPGIWFPASVSNLVESLILATVFVPIFHRLQLTNVYDYLELRFNVWVKYYAATIQVLFTLFYMAVQIYAPSLALSIVTGLSVNMSIIVVGGTCVIYTTIGGMKAVVWNDVFQTFVIVIGTFVMYAAGIPAVGGLKNVLQVTSSAGRGIGIDFTFDLSKPYTFWSAITGIPLAALSISACGQYNAQRYLVVKTVREARITAVFGQMFSLFFVVFYVFAGLLIYTHFAGCDPLANGEVVKEDQVFPLWLAEVFQTYPGVIGIMICASFSSSLSTASSGINAQAVMTHKEIKKLFPFMKDVTPERNIQFTKLLTGFLGSIILCVSFLATYIGGILDAVITWAGILTGPILAVFILGMVSRRATSLAAFLGMLSATIIGVWLKIGNSYYPRAPTSRPPLFTDQCNGTMMSMTTTMTSINDTYDSALFVNGDLNFAEIPTSVYQISYVYYSLIACIVTWLVALVVTVLTQSFQDIYGKVSWLDEDRKTNQDLFLHVDDLFMRKRKSEGEDQVEGNENEDHTENHAELQTTEPNI